MAIVTKRTVMSLFSEPDNVYSHQVRIVLAEKGVNVEIIPVASGEISKDLSALNPYHTLPTLIDRELVLFEARIIMEYLDERFPHPPLLPVYPVARAESRKMIHRMERDWYTLMHNIAASKDEAKSRLALKESLESLEPVFADKPFFLNEEFSLLDCVLGPLLWRLPQLDIHIEEKCEGLHRYMRSLFERETFQSSLTEAERQTGAA